MCPGGPFVIISVLNPALCQMVCASRIFTPTKFGTVARQVKVAVSVIAPLIVIEAGLFVPE
jgi:hypothetical protein